MGHARATYLGLLGATALSAVAGACASPPPISHIEDKARLDVPIAICRKQLQGGDVADGGSPRTDIYWGVIFPSFRGFGTALNPEDVDCVGERPAVELSGGGSSQAISADQLVVSTADDGKQVAWLRLASTPDGSSAGVLALMRPRTSEIDVYAIGRYKGSAKNSKFEIGQLGTTRMVTAHDLGCADVKVDNECDSTLDIYLVTGGKLTLATTTPEEKLRYGIAKGLGRVKYHLTTTAPVMDGKTLRVHEKLLVRDQNDEDVRKAEGDRVFAPGPDGKLVAQEDSLWSQVPANEAPAANPPPATNPSAATSAPEPKGAHPKKSH